MSLSRRRFLIGAAGMLAAGVVPTAQHFSVGTSRPMPPLVFIHGIKGSILTDGEGRVRWLSVWQALGLDSPDLSLPLRWQGELQQRDGLIAGGPLQAVGWEEVYAPFLNWAATSRSSFRAFSYDWRRDNLESTADFIRFLEGVRRENDGQSIQVVAHSMGGLIAFVALSRRPDLFHSVLFAGVPFGGTISFLEDMHAGTANGLNRSILRPLVLFTFPSIYSLFPEEYGDSGLVDANRVDIRQDWYSATDWERHGIGIFARERQGRATPEQRLHLERALQRSKQFRSEMVSRSAPNFLYPPIAVLAADHVPTTSKVIRNGPHAVRGWDFRSAAKQPGDGRVIFADAIPPDGVPFTLHKSRRQHAVLLNDTQQVAEILAQLG